jgi:hypothetical protein
VQLGDLLVDGHLGDERLGLLDGRGLLDGMAAGAGAAARAGTTSAVTTVAAVAAANNAGSFLTCELLRRGFQPAGSALRPHHRH